jgi:shikimate kinase
MERRALVRSQIRLSPFNCPILISLIGLPGSGKSTVGQQLARRLDLAFIDSDTAIEQRIGCSIREYFEREGEESFRDAEEARPSVLSTGGGAVLRQNNRDRLRANGYVVYLRSSPEEVFKRLRNDRNRPLLQVGDPLKRLRDLFAVRDPLYRETAHFVVETGRPSVTALVNMIVMQLELAGALPGSPSGES